MTIANQTFPNTRTDINSALQALASNNSGTSAPSTQFANQFWYKTGDNTLYIRNEGNDADIPVMVLDQTNDTVEYFKSDSIRTTLLEYTDGDDALTIADGGALTTAGNLSVGGSNNELRFYEGANWVGFEAGALTGDQIWVLPTADGDANQALTTNGSGTLSWSDAGGDSLRPNVNPLIINGDMQVNQRSSSVTGLGTASGYFTLDRWKSTIGTTSAGRYTMAQIADAPTGSGFRNCLKLSCTTADTSIATGERLTIDYIWEGQDLQMLKKGTSDATKQTLSFWVKGNASATYMAEIEDTDNTRHSTTQFSVTTSWAQIVIAVPADTTGALTNDNASSLALHFWLHGGATYTGGSYTAGTWAGTTTADRAVGISSIFDATSRTLFITGVRLEVGEFTAGTIPSFQHESVGNSLLRCQRYFYDPLDGSTDTYGSFALGTAISTTSAKAFVYSTVAMRTIPTIETSGAFEVEGSGYGPTVTSMATAGRTGRQAMEITFNVSSGLTAGQAVIIRRENDANATFQLGAEL